jgi:hypothetical protein
VTSPIPGLSFGTFNQDMAIRFLRQKPASTASELILASNDWEDAVKTVAVIDAQEFEAAHDNPAWLAFCEAADEYVAETLERELQVH